MILIVDLGYEYLNRLENLVDEFMDFEIVKIHDLTVEKIEKSKGVILTSAQIKIEVETAQNYLNQLNPLKDLKLPVLGIGLGHHFIGLLFGAQIAYQGYRNKIETISILYNDPLFDKLPDEIEVAFNHSGTISIPPNFELLGSSDSSINEAMKSKDKLIYGLQFLPELSGNHGRIIIQNFIAIVESV
jgi:GMP synthase-like glutamine amidotransferase